MYEPKGTNVAGKGGGVAIGKFPWGLGRELYRVTLFQYCACPTLSGLVSAGDLGKPDLSTMGEKGKKGPEVSFRRKGGLWGEASKRTLSTKAPVSPQLRLSLTLIRNRIVPTKDLKKGKAWPCPN